MVNRIYVEKREAYRQASEKILHELRDLYGLKGLTALRLLQRYDVEELSPDLLERAKRQVFSDPPLDIVREELDTSGADFVLRVEYLPGQYDQKADSAAQCIQVLGEVERPLIRTARVFLFYGTLGPEDEEKIRRYLINPVESREAAAEKAQTLKREPRELPPIPDLPGFRELDEAALARFLETYALAMDLNDLRLTRDYFRQEGRDPSETEIRILDTYWSDHCRHSTFLTELKQVQIDDPDVRASYEDYLAKRAEIGRTKPVSLMDLGTFAGRYLRKKGRLPNVDESEEVNACTIKMPLKRNGKDEDWLLFFKNETHNHPTEIEPFGGAATCIGGAIRDPLSGRAYVHAAMRLTGAADPTVPVSETLPGKLPQRKLVTTAADGYSSYGNQIGLATGMVDEIYHAGYRAKRLEVGAVIAAAPASQVLREEPAPGDVVLLLGGRTGRDGIGGATGSSKSHHIESVQESGSEVQKGNAPEERKLQRFFRHPEASRCIKRCNDFGAGGVSVAVGELAPGLEINLDAVPKKYDGLNGTELAISESQERMAICVAEKDVAIVSRVAAEENLEISRIATVTAEPRLRMFWRGERIVDLSRDFLDSNGASREADARVGSASPFSLEDALEDAQRGRGGKAVSGIANSEAAAASAPPASRLADLSFREACLRLAGDLNICSKQGLVERFDSTVGANTVLMPYGGREQMTPIQTMVQRIPLLDGQSERVSFMSWGFNPMITERDPWRGAYWAVVESVSKLIAAGSDRREIYLSFQEYFERLRREPERWGKVLAALLGAYQAQMDLGIAAIGGKDSMSGSFENLDVPPSFISFAVSYGNLADVRSPELKGAGHELFLLQAPRRANGLPVTAELEKNYDRLTEAYRQGRVLSAWQPAFGAVAEGLMKMAFGNRIGIHLAPELKRDLLFSYAYGDFILELADGEEAPEDWPGTRLGSTIAEPELRFGGEVVPLREILKVYRARLESVYPTDVAEEGDARAVEEISPAPSARCETNGIREASGLARSETRWSAVTPLKGRKVRFIIPVFPGTNCEYETLRAVEAAGGEGRTLVFRNLCAADVRESLETLAGELEKAEVLFLPGGFSGADEPDGSAKFAAAILRNPKVSAAVMRLIRERDGLIGGICNGFQVLIKLGLLPYGEIREPGEGSPSLSYNRIARHQSRLVRIRLETNASPWLQACRTGDIFTVPISHGEGRFLATPELQKRLISHGQILSRYVDPAGEPSQDIRFNPNGSDLAIEGLISEDGRIFGKMGHSERIGEGLYKNVEGRYDMGLFRSAVAYFS